MEGEHFVKLTKLIKSTVEVLESADLNQVENARLVRTGKIVRLSTA